MEDHKGHERDWFMIIIGTLASIAIPAFLAIFFAALGGWDRFLYAWEMLFWIFGAGGAAGSLLNLFKIIPADLAFPFGCGLYYGTVGVAIVLQKLGLRTTEEWLLFLGFVIAALTCYIVYLKLIKGGRS